MNAQEFLNKAINRATAMGCKPRGTEAQRRQSRLAGIIADHLKDGCPLCPLETECIDIPRHLSSEIVDRLIAWY